MCCMTGLTSMSSILLSLITKHTCTKNILGGPTMLEVKFCYYCFMSSNINLNKTIIHGVASLQLPLKYQNLPANLIG